MKRIAILLIMITSVLVVHAQQGLHINELFKGAIIPQDEMMETRVRGKMIAKYRLSYCPTGMWIGSPISLSPICWGSK